MRRTYTTTYTCQYCGWHLTRLATTELGLMADEEELELLAAEHTTTIHPNQLPR